MQTTHVFSDFGLKIWHKLNGADWGSRVGMLRWRKATGVLGAVFLLFPLLLLLPLLPGFLLLVVPLLFFVLLFVRVGTAYVRRRSLLPAEHLPGLVLVLLMLVLVFTLWGLINVSVLLWQLQGNRSYANEQFVSS